ncbi:mCG147365 [Mus musculus]|nr:mCG147365 [Mus musculus]
MALDTHLNSLDHAPIPFMYMMTQRFQLPTTVLINSLRDWHPES